MDTPTAHFNAPVDRSIRRVLIVWRNPPKDGDPDNECSGHLCYVEKDGHYGRGNILLKLNFAAAGDTPYLKDVRRRFPEARIVTCQQDTGDKGEEAIHLAWLMEGIIESPSCIRCGRDSKICVCQTFCARPFKPNQYARTHGGWPLVPSAYADNQLAPACPHCYSQKVSINRSTHHGWSPAIFIRMNCFSCNCESSWEIG